MALRIRVFAVAAACLAAAARARAEGLPPEEAGSPAARGARPMGGYSAMRWGGWTSLGGAPEAAGAVPDPGEAGPADPAYAMVLEHLAGTAVPRAFIDAAFRDPGVRVEPKVLELLSRPGESLPYEEYRRRSVSPQRIEGGAAFYRANQALVDAAAAAYKVDPFVVLSIVGVESNYGRAKGSFTVFNALYTIANRVPRRSRWAGRELAEFVRLCHSEGWGGQDVMGSYAGAFGWGQFMPTSFSRYYVDHDGDGLRSPYGWPDTLASVANYLARNGYKPGETDFSRGSSAWSAVHAYNHSENYVRAVLDLRLEVLARVRPAVARAR